jgi:hypothetical protein
MGWADFGSGVQGVLRQRMLDQIEAEERAEKVRQFNERLGLDQSRLGEDTRQFDARLGFDQGKEAEDLRRYTADAPQREANLGYIRTQTRHLEETPLRAEAERQATDARDKTLHGYRLGEIGAQNAGKVAPKSLADELAEFEAKEQIKAKYGGAKPSIGTQKSALAFFNRMLEAERNARDVENQIGNYDTLLGGDLPFVPEWAENVARTDVGQRYLQAQRAFTEARLRKESGAAIAQNEYENDRRINFRGTGDEADTLKQKRGSRLQTLRGLGFAAGPALQEFYGSDASLDSLLKEFAEQEVGGLVAMVAPDGRSLNVPADKVAEMEAKGAKRR